MPSLRNVTALAAVTCAVGAGMTTAVATTATAATPHAAKTQLDVKSTKIGKILVTNGGLIVYIFTHDQRDKNRCPAGNGCATVWPPLTGTPSLGKGVKASLVGHIKDGSKQQLTYAGHPLYGYEYNSTSVSYVGYSNFGGAWDAISPSGSVVHNKPV